MIVQPDFLTHWKTQMLISALNDPCAPLYVIALWGHCQTSRRDRFDGMTGEKLAAMCRYCGDGEKLLQAMVSIGFLEYEEDACVVHGWAELNARLLHNWKVGLLGGRPKNPRDTQGLSKGNPRLTLGEPLANPLDKIREEKRRSTPKTAAKNPESVPAENGESGVNKSRHAKFIRLWSERFEAHFRTKYPFAGGRDGKAVAALVKDESEPIEEIIRTAERAWSIPGFVGQSAAVIHSFHDQRAKIVQALACQNQGPNGLHAPERKYRSSKEFDYCKPDDQIPQSELRLPDRAKMMKHNA